MPGNSRVLVSGTRLRVVAAARGDESRSSPLRTPQRWRGWSTRRSRRVERGDRASRSPRASARGTAARATSTRNSGRTSTIHSTTSAGASTTSASEGRGYAWRSPSSTPWDASPNAHAVATTIAARHRDGARSRRGAAAWPIARLARAWNATFMESLPNVRASRNIRLRSTQSSGRPRADHRLIDQPTFASSPSNSGIFAARNRSSRHDFVAAS